MDPQTRRPVALLSVYDKTGIVEFAQALVELGFDLLSSGKTAKALSGAGVPVKDVAELVGEPILDHRVVTLSRGIHAALLARDTGEDRAELARIGVPWIDLVCVDLYPLAQEIKRVGSTRESVTNMTDIGGPTLLRSAAKGGRIVVCAPGTRMQVIDWLRAGKPNETEMVQALAACAEATVAAYALQSAHYHSSGKFVGLIGVRSRSCRYGENANQTPAELYSMGMEDPLALDRFEVVQGRTPSYVNLCDLDRLLQTMTHAAAIFDRYDEGVPCLAFAAKHGNACGGAYAERADAALLNAVLGDPRAIFGGILMVNFPMTYALANLLITCGMPVGKRRILDGVIAPSFTPDAMTEISREKCRLIANPALGHLTRDSLDCAQRFRYVRGGFLIQPNYTYVPDVGALREAAIARIDKGQIRGWSLAQEMHVQSRFSQDVMLAWAIGATSNSNTITLVKNGKLIGNAVGQQDRVGACELALKRARDAGHDPKGAAAYSDSFFPFPDGPGVLIDAGISVIHATSGSINDQKVIDLCAAANVPLYLSPDAEARGFFGH